jgi:hypothetical protein
MAATGISQEAEWVFLMSTLLQHDFILAVPKQKTERSTMQSAFHVPLIWHPIQFADRPYR